MFHTVCFLGYPPNHRGYPCYEISSRKIIISRHVLFDENTFPFTKLHIVSPHKYDSLDSDLSPYVIYQMHQKSTPLLHLMEQPSPTDPSSPGIPSQTAEYQTPFSFITTMTNNPTQSQATNPQIHRMTTRIQNGIFKPNLKYHNLSATTITCISPVPKNSINALNDPNWKYVMLDENNALIKNKTWELVPRPPNVNIIHSVDFST